MSPEEGWGGVFPRCCVLLTVPWSKSTTHTHTHTHTHKHTDSLFNFTGKTPEHHTIRHLRSRSLGGHQKSCRSLRTIKKVTSAVIEALLSDYWEASWLLRELLSLQINSYACKCILIELLDSVYRAELLDSSVAAACRELVGLLCATLDSTLVHFLFASVFIYIIISIVPQTRSVFGGSLCTFILETL